MKTLQCVSLLAAGLIVGLCLGTGGTGPNANAQGPPITAPTSRFQIAEYSHAGSPHDAGQHGCYILDTVTGELWHAENNDVVNKIVEKPLK